MKHPKLIAAALTAALGIAAPAVRAEMPDSIGYTVGVIGGGANHAFNPYLLGANNFGRTPMGGTALLDVAAHKTMDLSSRFSWEAGVEALTGYSRKADYMKYAPDGQWTSRGAGPAPVWLQQLYGSVKYRGVFASVGMKERGSELVNDTLSSGDLVHSANARPIPQVRVGFVDFQNIPFTNGWAQINGKIAYGKMDQGKYLENHYNYYSSHITTGSLYMYANIYFRSNPAKPLMVTVGMTHAGMFGGTTSFYDKGQLTRTVHNSQKLKTFWQMFIPKQGNADNYFDGSHLGSWDFRADWRLAGGHTLSGYFQWLWEDGSGMGRRNKWDGLWGVEYRREGGGHVLDGAVIEYIDFRDQSGPMHWAPGDHPGTTITGEATGGDDYYNNSAFNAYAYHGLSMGTPFIVSPLYNTNGYPQFMHTRSRGFHAAACGTITGTWRWRAAVSHAVAWGQGRLHTNEPLHNTSAMARVDWDGAFGIQRLSASAALAFDAGSLRGDNVGALVSLTYTGNINFSK